MGLYAFWQINAQWAGGATVLIQDRMICDVISEERADFAGVNNSEVRRRFAGSGVVAERGSGGV